MKGARNEAGREANEVINQAVIPLDSCFVLALAAVVTLLLKTSKLNTSK